MLPIKVAFHTHFLTIFQEELNNKTLREALYLLPFVLGNALLREAFHKIWVARIHDHTVKLHPIRVGDLVLHQTEAMARADEHGKLIANYEGSHKVTE